MAQKFETLQLHGGYAPLTLCIAMRFPSERTSNREQAGARPGHQL